MTIPFFISSLMVHAYFPESAGSLFNLFSNVLNASVKNNKKLWQAHLVHFSELINHVCERRNERLLRFTPSHTIF